MTGLVDRYGAALSANRLTRRKMLAAGLGLAASIPAFSTHAGVISPPFNPANSVPGVRNWDRANLPKTIAGLARVRSNQGSMTINVAGHSALMGQGAGTTNNSELVAGAQPYSVAAVLAKHLNASPRLKARLSGVNSALKTPIPSEFTAYDTRVTMSADWVFATGNAGVGTGGYLWQNTTGTGALSVTPTAPDGTSMVWDTCRVWYGINTGLGTFTLDTGGAALATQATAGSVALGSVTIGPGQGVSRAAQALNLKRTTGGGAYPVLFEFWDSTINDIRVRGLGWSGSQASDWVDASFPYHAFNALPVMGGDLTIFEAYRNDQSHGVAVATWQANFDAAVAKWLTFGDVIILADHEPQTWTLTNDAQFRAGLQAVSDKYSVPLVDIRYFLGSGAQGAARGYMSPDQVHYNATGWDAKTAIIADLLTSL